MGTTKTVTVWDPLVRAFHWALVGSFAIAFLTEDDWMGLHAAAGYVVTSLLVFRIIWGFIGTRHARFSDFVRTPVTVIAYLKSLLRPNAPRYLGHNPAGGAMIVALIVTLVLTTVSGLAVYAIGEGAGPLAQLLADVPGRWEDAVGELHEALANMTLVLVAIHVAGVAVESVRHRENLVRAMWTGNKRVTD
jgi:cytochrome b